MPIEPLSITASVIGITRLTFDSCKVLNNTIKGIKRAPSKLKELETSLDAFQNVIKPFEEDLASHEDAALSQDQLASLKALEPVMLYCRDICDKFTKRITEITSHSDENHMAWRDRLRLNFHDSEIRLLKENLAQCQRTLSDALGFANLRAASQTRDALDAFASTYASTLSDITGQIRGLATSMEALSMSTSGAAKEDVDNLLNALKEQDRMLRACLEVYQPAVREASTQSGTTVKYARAFDRAKVFTGNIDFHGEASAVSVGTKEARDDSRMITGNISGAFASEFFK